MNPTFSYYGSKWRVARYYPPPRPGLPIVEPFAGAAGYAHWWDDGRRDVLLLDADPRVAALWTWLLAATPAEIRDLPLLTDDGRVPDDLPEGAALLIGWYCGYALAEPRTTISANVDWARYPMKCWGAPVRRRVAENRLRMGDRWHFVGTRYDEAPDIQATWFVDPPYANAAGRRYSVKFDDHTALGSWCKKRRWLVIACDNEGATWLDFEVLTQQRSARHRQRSTEAVWTSEPWRLL